MDQEESGAAFVGDANDAQDLELTEDASNMRTSDGSEQQHEPKLKNDLVDSTPRLINLAAIAELSKYKIERTKALD